MTVTTLPRQATGRIVGLDVARGAAILLMVLDHVLYQAAPGHVLRLTVTRVALPIFCLVAGALWRPGWRPRYLELGAAWLVAEVLARLLGMPTPDVLLPIAVGFALLHLAQRSPWLVLVVLLVLDHSRLGAIPGWTGYSPWYVAALLVVGHLARAEIYAAAERLPDVAWLSSIGRRPLGWYVGHLLVLAVVVQLGTATPTVLMAPGPFPGDPGSSEVLASVLLVT